MEAGWTPVSLICTDMKQKIYSRNLSIYLVNILNSGKDDEENPKNIKNRII